MIFILRLIIFSAMILSGFYLSLRSVTLRRIVTAVYTFALLWYTFLCRIPTLMSTEVYGDNIPSAPAQQGTSNVFEQIGRVLITIFGSQPDGTLAGEGVAKAMVFNALLFVPLSFLILLWFPQLRKSWNGRAKTVLSCTGVSLLIELTQALAGLGMADWKDVVGNTAGAVVGVVMVMSYDRFYSDTGNRSVDIISKRK